MPTPSPHHVSHSRTGRSRGRGNAAASVSPTNRGADRLQPPRANKKDLEAAGGTNPRHLQLLHDPRPQDDHRTWPGTSEGVLGTVPSPQPCPRTTASSRWNAQLVRGRPVIPLPGTRLRRHRQLRPRHLPEAAGAHGADSCATNTMTPRAWAAVLATSLHTSTGPGTDAAVVAALVALRRRARTLNPDGGRLGLASREGDAIAALGSNRPEVRCRSRRAGPTGPALFIT